MALLIKKRIELNIFVFKSNVYSFIMTEIAFNFSPKDIEHDLKIKEV